MLDLSRVVWNNNEQHKAYLLTSRTLHFTHIDEFQEKNKKKHLRNIENKETEYFACYEYLFCICVFFSFVLSLTEAHLTVSTESGWSVWRLQEDGFIFTRIL